MKASKRGSRKRLVPTPNLTETNEIFFTAISSISPFTKLETTDNVVNVSQMNRQETIKRKKEKVYNMLDRQKFGPFHLKAIVFTGMGFFTVTKFLFLSRLSTTKNIRISKKFSFLNNN